MASEVKIKAPYIIQIDPQEGFDQLSFDEAKRRIYDVLVPILENKRVWLSQGGNHKSNQCYGTEDQYKEKKRTQTLFDVARIQKAFAEVHKMVKSSHRYELRSYGFKHVVEKIQRKTLGDKSYISVGDCIAAMILRGYAARFKDADRRILGNAEIKAQLNDEYLEANGGELSFFGWSFS